MDEVKKMENEMMGYGLIIFGLVLAITGYFNLLIPLTPKYVQIIFGIIMIIAGTSYIAKN